jgi:hypothetical protein
VSRIWLWNRGREPIRQEDTPIGDPLRIEPVGDTRLLGVEVLETSYKASDFSCSLPDDRGVVQIGFASLDQAQGGVLQVVHTGTSSDDILVKWTVVGGNPLKKVDIQSFTVSGSILLNRIRSFVRFLVMLAASTVLPATFAVGVYYSIEDGRIFSESSLFPTLVMFGAFAAVFLFFGLRLAFRSYNDTMLMLPRGLEAYLQGFIATEQKAP